MSGSSWRTCNRSARTSCAAQRMRWPCSRGGPQARGVDDQRWERGARRRLRGAEGRCAVHGRGHRDGAGLEARADEGARREARSRPVRGRMAGPRRPRLSRSRRHVRASVRRSELHHRPCDHGPGDSGGRSGRRCSHRRHRRRRAHHRGGQRDEGPQAGNQGLGRRTGNRRARRPALWPWGLLRSSRTGRLRSSMAPADKSVFPRMWERMQPVVDGYIVVSLEETKRAMRLMAEKARVISEGAGALPLAAALTGKAGRGPDRGHRLRREHRPGEVFRARGVGSELTVRSSVPGPSPGERHMADKETTSFMRSLCMGVIEEDVLLPFPVMADKEGETLRAIFESLKQFLGNRDRDFRAWDLAGELPASMLEELRQFGLFGLVLPEDAGGLGLGSTAYSRTLQEISRYDGSVAVTVGAHSSIGHARAAALRHAGAEGALLSEARHRRDDRRLLPHRARRRLGRGEHQDHRGARRRRLGARTAASCGSPTAGSPASSPSSPRPASRTSAGKHHRLHRHPGHEGGQRRSARGQDGPPRLVHHHGVSSTTCECRRPTCSARWARASRWR